MDSCETQASRIPIFPYKGYKSLTITVYKTEWTTFFFFCMCFLLALSLLQLAQCAGKKVILTGFFMSDVWSHQWKSLCGSWIGGSCVLHVRGSVDDCSRSNILLKVQENCARSALKLCHVTISKKVYVTVAKIWRSFRSIFNDTSRVFLWQT